MTIDQSKPTPTYSFSPIFKFNQSFYGSLRCVFGRSLWLDPHKNLRYFLKPSLTLNTNQYRFPPMFHIEYKSWFHRRLGKGFIHKTSINKANFDHFIRQKSLRYGYALNYDVSYEWLIKILQLINQCYSWQLSDPSQLEELKASIEDNLNAIIEDTPKFKIGSLNIEYMIKDLRGFLESVQQIDYISSKSEIQKLTIELMVDINLAFINLMQNKEGFIKPDHFLFDLSLINFNDFNTYIEPIKPIKFRNDDYYDLKDIQDALDRYLNEHLQDKITQRAIAGQNYCDCIGRMVYWHNFYYEQATPDEMAKEREEGNDLYNIYCCYSNDFCEFKKSKLKNHLYPYLEDIYSAEYIRTVRPDFEAKLNRMAQILNWDSKRADRVERLYKNSLES